MFTIHISLFSTLHFSSPSISLFLFLLFTKFSRQRTSNIMGLDEHRISMRFRVLKGILLWHMTGSMVALSKTKTKQIYQIFAIWGAVSNNNLTHTSGGKPIISWQTQHSLLTSQTGLLNVNKWANHTFVQALGVYPIQGYKMHICMLTNLIYTKGYQIKAETPRPVGHVLQLRGK